MQTKADTLSKISQGNPFFGKWDMILDTVGTAFNLDDKDKDKYRSVKMAQLIAAIPYLADCDDPDRTAISNIGTYLLTVRTNQIFDHKPSDDKNILRRIQMINNYIGGNKKIIKRGLNMILLNMICDYQRDLEQDNKTGKYNPISAGKLDFEKEKQKLMKQIKSVNSPYMDEIIDPEAVPNAWWVS